MKRVLILHISDFGGHKSAARNIEEALRYREPDIEILNINILRYLWPRTEKLIDVIYTFTIKKIPALWGKVYDRKKIVKSINPLVKVLNKLSFIKFSRLMKRFKPDVIIATQAFPCSIAADYKKKHKLSIPIVGVVTDYHPHRFWVHSSVDLYSVASEEARQVLMREGVVSECVKLLGIPISLRFLNTHPRHEVAAEHGFRKDLPTVLVMGGGLGIGPIKEVVSELCRLDEEFQLVVICGKNRKLFKWIKTNGANLKKSLFYYSYVGFVDELMDFSDIIITKAGGVTTAEALAKALALVILSPIPGQEEKNVDYLSRQGALLEAKHVLEIGRIVKSLLDDKAYLFSLKEKAKDNSVVDSSLRIVDSILARMYAQAKDKQEEKAACCEKEQIATACQTKRTKAQGLTMYYLYRLGVFLALNLSRRVCYFLAKVLANIHFCLSKKDRQTIFYNLKPLVSDAKQRRKVAREVFSNFAYYLVDFFSHSQLDKDFIRDYVTFQGKEHLDRLVEEKKGAVGLTAHIGNWELGGVVTCMLGYKLYAIALPHANEKINEFFNQQRGLWGLEVIPTGAAVKRCYKLLREGERIMFLGDREFGDAGKEFSLCGHRAIVPRGPAYFSRRTGSYIVPCFFVREDRDHYRLVFEEPISPYNGQRKKSEDELITEYLKILEKYIRMYPSQWYMFEKYWVPKE